MAFRLYRRRRPHLRWRGATYLVNWRIEPGQPELSGRDRDIIVDALKHFDGVRYRLHAFVVMNDHVHVVVTPFTGFELESILKSWKGYSSRRIHDAAGRRGRLWQCEGYDRILRDRRSFEIALHYVALNPIKRWPTARHYRWLWIELQDRE
jgi:REP element-mobilizing transposase RayT